MALVVYTTPQGRNAERRERVTADPGVGERKYVEALTSWVASLAGAPIGDALEPLVKDNWTVV